MNENELKNLFQQGSALERDEQFARQVADEVRQARIIARLVTCVQLSLFACVALGIYILATLVSPITIQASSFFSGVLSSPLVQIVVAITGAAIAYWRRPAY